MNFLLKISIIIFFIIICILLFYSKERFEGAVKTLDFTEDGNILLKKNLFINYDEKEINNIIDEYSLNTEPGKKNTSDGNTDTNDTQQYEVPNSRNNNRDLLKHNLFINNEENEYYKKNLAVKNELCIGGYCLDSDILKKVGGHVDGPHFYAEENPFYENKTPKPIYYNHDNLIPMAKSVCINNKSIFNNISNTGNDIIIDVPKSDEEKKIIFIDKPLENYDIPEKIEYKDMIENGLRGFSTAFRGIKDKFKITPNVSENSITIERIGNKGWEDKFSFKITKKAKYSNSSNLHNNTCLNANHFDMINGNKGLRLYGGNNIKIIDKDAEYDAKISEDNKSSIKLELEQTKQQQGDLLMPYYIDYGKTGKNIGSVKTDLLFKKFDSCCQNNLVYPKNVKGKKEHGLWKSWHIGNPFIIYGKGEGGGGKYYRGKQDHADFSRGNMGKHNSNVLLKDSGRIKCQKWTDQEPNEHSRTPEDYPNMGLGDHNYCRNPDGEAAPWCYTSSDGQHNVKGQKKKAKRWNYCSGVDNNDKLTDTYTTYDPKSSCLYQAQKNDKGGSPSSNYHSCSHNGNCGYDENIKNALDPCRNIDIIKDGGVNNCEKNAICRIADHGYTCELKIPYKYPNTSDLYSIDNSDIPNIKNRPISVDESKFKDNKYNAPNINFSISPSTNKDGSILEDGSYFHGHEHVHESGGDLPCILKNKTTCDANKDCIYENINTIGDDPLPEPDKLPNKFRLAVKKVEEKAWVEDNLYYYVVNNKNYKNKTPLKLGTKDVIGWWEKTPGTIYPTKITYEISWNTGYKYTEGKDDIALTYNKGFRRDNASVNHSIIDNKENEITILLEYKTKSGKYYLKSLNKVDGVKKRIGLDLSKGFNIETNRYDKQLFYADGLGFTVIKADKKEVKVIPLEGACRNKEYINVRVKNESHWLDGFESGVNIYSYRYKDGELHYDTDGEHSNEYKNPLGDMVDDKQSLSRDDNYIIKVYENGYLKLEVDTGGGIELKDYIFYDKLKEVKKEFPYINYVPLTIYDGDDDPGKTNWSYDY